MNGYMLVRVMSAGVYFDCWQKIENGTVVAHVQEDGAPIELPEIREEFCLIKKLESHLPIKAERLVAEAAQQATSVPPVAGGPALGETE